MIKLTYVGAFIVPNFKEFQNISVEEQFYREFYETDKFRTAYQGLEEIDVLIPSSNNFALKDQEDYHDEFFLYDFSKLNSLEDKLRNEYNETIIKLKELYPNGSFVVRSGIISYWDEEA